MRTKNAPKRGQNALPLILRAEADGVCASIRRPRYGLGPAQGLLCKARVKMLRKTARANTSPRPAQERPARPAPPPTHPPPPPPGGAPAKRAARRGAGGIALQPTRLDALRPDQQG